MPNNLGTDMNYPRYRNQSARKNLSFLLYTTGFQVYENSDTAWRFPPFDKAVLPQKNCNVKTQRDLLGLEDY